MQANRFCSLQIGTDGQKTAIHYGQKVILSVLIKTQN